MVFLRRNKITFMDVFIFVEVAIIAAVICFNTSAIRYMLGSPLAKSDRLPLAIISGFGCFSLAVVGMGITGIQLLLIARKKEEIGLNLAVGATSRHIVWMIMGRCVFKILLPSVPGLLLGCFATPAISRALDVAASVDAKSLLGAFLVVMSFGVGVGVYPALRACSIEPIDAMGRAPGLR